MQADPIRVVLAGYGHLGRELAAGIELDAGFTVVGVTRRSIDSPTITLPSGRSVPLSADLATLLTETQAHVLLDATTAEAAAENAHTALTHGVPPVIATTGLSPAAIETIEQLCAERGLGTAIVPNFALGAAVLLHLARVAAQHFDWAEIIELHHDKKADAPSGTSLHIAREMVASRGQDFQRAETAKYTLADVRAGQQGGVGIHSVRLPGFVAHQEVIFGGLGQTLTLRHDSTSRESFLPGALASLRYVLTSTGVTVGLDKVLGLE